MNRARLALLVLLMGTMCAVPVLAVTSGQPNVTVYLSENRVSAGEATELEFSLQNRGEIDRSDDPSLDERITTARGVEVELDADDAPIDVKTGERSIGSVRDGETASVSFRVVVDEDAEPGEYDVTVRYEYEYVSRISQRSNQSSTYVDTTEIEREDVSIRVVDDARFEIEDVESDVAVGDSGTVTANVTNAGSRNANDATFTVTSESGAVSFDGTESASTFVDVWEPDETRALSFDVDVAEGADERNYRLTGRVEYEDDDGQDAQSSALPFGVTPAAEQTFDLDAVESDLRVGDDGTVRGELVNTGETTAHNVVATLETGTDTIDVLEPRFAVGTLEAGDRAVVEFDADVSDNARDGPRQFTLQPEYRNTADDQRTGDAIDISVDVASKQDEFLVEAADATVESGGDGVLVLAVTNERNETFTDVSAKLFVESPVTVSDDESYIDELEPGETVEIPFAVGVEGGAMEKTYPVEVDFRYEDADGDDRVSDTYNVPVEVVRASDDGLPVSLLLGGFVVLAVAGYLYRRR